MPCPPKLENCRTDSASLRYLLFCMFDPTHPVWISPHSLSSSDAVGCIKPNINYRYLSVLDCPIFDIELAGPGGLMKVICAWCEEEGRYSLIREVELYDRQLTSHGICRDHKKVVLKRVQELRNTENPRPQRWKHSPTKLRSSTWVPASRTTRVRTPKRRRLLKNPLSSAQLQIPFIDL